MLSHSAKLGPYTLVRPLGKGGFGTVWLGERRTPIAKTNVALKIPLSTDIDLEMVRREAEVWAPQTMAAKKSAPHGSSFPLFWVLAVIIFLFLVMAGILIYRLSSN